MPNFELKKIKIIFSAGIICLSAFLIVGGLVIEAYLPMAEKKGKKLWDYAKYRAGIAFSDNKILGGLLFEGRFEGALFSASPSETEARETAQAVPVLLYHGIVKKGDGLNVSLKNFEDQMFVLRKAGYQTASLEDFYKFLRGEKDLPDKSFVLTFDDGRKDSYYPVDPILQVLGYRAAIYAISGRVNEFGSEFQLSYKEFREMIKSGRWEIGSHGKDDHEPIFVSSTGSKGHFLSNKKWLIEKKRFETEEEYKSRIKDDLFESKKILEDNLGIHVSSFSYPFGDFGQQSVNFPQSINILNGLTSSVYDFSFYQIWKGGDFSFNYPKKDLFMAKRIKVEPSWNGEDLLKALNMANAKKLPYSDDFSINHGWVKVWGVMQFTNDGMAIKSNSMSTGSFIFLDGSFPWKNYFFKADVNWLKGDTISLVARYRDADNFMACNFTRDFIFIQEKINGEDTLTQKPAKNSEVLQGEVSLGIKVNDDKIECYANNQLVASMYYVSSSLNKGGIGFKIWDKNIDNSEIIVKYADVQEIKQ